MLKECLYLKQYNLLFYKIKCTYINLKEFENNLLKFYISFTENTLVLFNRKHNISIIYKKLNSYYYLKIIPEFFLPLYSKIFIFRFLFLKQLFFLSTLFLLRHKTFRFAMKRLALRYFYIKNLQYYFATRPKINSLVLITSQKKLNINSEKIVIFNVVDFLFFDFCLL